MIDHPDWLSDEDAQRAAVTIDGLTVRERNLMSDDFRVMSIAEEGNDISDGRVSIVFRDSSEEISIRIAREDFLDRQFAGLVSRLSDAILTRKASDPTTRRTQS
jgi:hypothetical protein